MNRFLVSVVLMCFFYQLSVGCGVQIQPDSLHIDYSAKEDFSHFVFKPDADTIRVERVVNMVRCKGGYDGAIDITVSGGTVPYSFMWSNGALTEDVFSLTKGIYTLLVEDAIGNTSFQTIEITEPEPLRLTESHIDPY